MKQVYSVHVYFRYYLEGDREIHSKDIWLNVQHDSNNADEIGDKIRENFTKKYENHHRITKFYIDVFDVFELIT